MRSAGCASTVCCCRGVTTLARLVARARAEGDRRLWETLASVPSEAELRELDAFLDVAEGSRMSELERARKGPADPTGKNLRLLLARVKDLHRLGVDGDAGPVLRALELPEDPTELLD